jgi:thiamine-monophosphate kinase
MTNSSSDRRPGEFQLIAKYFAPLTESSPGALGLSDDAAFLALRPGEELVVTTDALIEGVHFLHDDPPEMIAAKSLRVNLSDLAAKGATPAGYLLALCLPGWPDESWLAAFCDGLASDQKNFAAPLLGGDTTATPGPLVVTITALGFVPAGSAIHRSGAQPGDAVFVSGTVGDAGAGLELLKAPVVARSADEGELIGRYRMPVPRLALGRRLRGLASAALDVSDGLIADLNHISEVSRVRIVVDAPRVPVSPAFLRVRGNDLQSRVFAATAGDDYEIAFTAPAGKRDAVVQAGARAGVPVSEIGHIEAGSGTILRDEQGREVPLERTGWVHL